MRVWLMVLALGGVAQAICPRYCTCDVWQDALRVSCAARNLANTYLEVPQTTRTLVLSRNALTTIRAHEFQDAGLCNLWTLLLNHNQIFLVSSLAFSGLNQLKYLDLSGNKIAQLDPATFISNKNLTTLVLSRNRLSVMLQGSFLNAPSIQELHISECSLEYLPNTFFLGLENLRTLNLSGNTLWMVHPEIFTALPKVQQIDLLGNPLVCNSDATKLLQFLQDRRIQFTKFCEAKFQAPILEKVVLESTYYSRLYGLYPDAEVEWVTEKPDMRDPKSKEEMIQGAGQEAELNHEPSGKVEQEANLVSKEVGQEAELNHEPSGKVELEVNLVSKEVGQEAELNHEPPETVEQETESKVWTILNIFTSPAIRLMCKFLGVLIVGLIILGIRCCVRRKNNPPLVPVRTVSLPLYTPPVSNPVVWSEMPERRDPPDYAEAMLLPPGTPPCPYRSKSAL